MELEHLIICFAILLVLLILISTFGGSTNVALRPAVAPAAYQQQQQPRPTPMGAMDPSSAAYWASPLQRESYGEGEGAEYDWGSNEVNGVGVNEPYKTYETDDSAGVNPDEEEGAGVYEAANEGTVDGSNNEGGEYTESYYNAGNMGNMGADPQDENLSPVEAYAGDTTLYARAY